MVQALHSSDQVEVHALRDIRSQSMSEAYHEDVSGGIDQNSSLLFARDEASDVATGEPLYELLRNRSFRPQAPTEVRGCPVPTNWLRTNRVLVYSLSF